MVATVSAGALHNPGLPITMRCGELEFTAFSISGLASYVMVPSLRAVFDLGHCAVEAIGLDRVFLSHVHQDHCAGVPRHLWLREMHGLPAPTVYCPVKSVEGLRALLDAFSAMEERPFGDPATVHGVSDGDVISLGKRKSIRVFDVCHRLASVGYTVTSQRRVLTAPWVGAPAAELHAALARGEKIHTQTEVDLLTYIGDSTIETLRRHPRVGNSRVLFLEATHLPGTSLSKAHEYGHTHLDELVALWREAPETLASPHIVLKHFSMRYTAGEIREAIASLPTGLRERVVAVI